MTIRQEPLVLIAREDLDLSDPHRVIGQQPFIRYDRDQWGGQIVERYLKQHNLEVCEWLEIDALDAIAALVSRGVGVAIVPDWAPPWPEGLLLNKKLLPTGEIRHTGVIPESGLRACTPPDPEKDQTPFRLLFLRSLIAHEAAAAEGEVAGT